MGHTTENSSSYCICPRTNVTVGRQRVSMQFGHFGSGFISKLSHLLDGLWYSTPAEGECQGEHKPGDGSGCSWKVSKIAKVVNASCVERRVYSNIETRNSACFASCLHKPAAARAGPAPPNRSSPCVNKCFEAAVVGSSGGDGQAELAPMTATEILEPWNRAFQARPGAGVCPPCVLDAAAGMYNCPTPWNND